MKSLKQLFEEKQNKARDKHISREFQEYGLRLAEELSDMQHKSLYIKLAKTENRALLETCRRYATDSNSERKGAVFMWKLKELRNNAKSK